MSVPASEWSEVELVEGMLAGESAAWQAFARRYDGLIYTCIDRVLRCFSALSSRVERDEVYAALLGSLLSRDMHKLRVFEFERGVRLSTWVSLLATNAARDHVRAAMRRPQQSVTPGAFDDLEDGAPGPLADLLVKEAMSRVMDALSGFSSKDRQLVQLLFMQAQEPEQVAEAMRISVKTVYSKKHKLRSRLEDALRV